MITPILFLKGKIIPDFCLKNTEDCNPLELKFSMSDGQQGCTLFTIMFIENLGLWSKY